MIAAADIRATIIRGGHTLVALGLHETAEQAIEAWCAKFGKPPETVYYYCGWWFCGPMVQELDNQGPGAF